MRTVKFKRVTYVENPNDFYENTLGEKVFRKNKREETWHKGKFHQWGLEASDGVSESVAVVEMQDGTVVLVEPERITFTDVPGAT